MNKLKPGLKLFLEKENCLNNFNKNTNKVSHKRFTRDHCFSSIMGSFRWRYTSEGFLFWKNLHVKYEKSKN